MSPRQMLWLGFIGGVVCSFAILFAPLGDSAGTAVVCLWACGALFGKGYGVQEQREVFRRRLREFRERIAAMISQERAP